MKKEIVNHLTWLTNQLAQTPVYGKEIIQSSEIFEAFYESLKNHLDVTKLTREEARELRFGKWDDESDLYLFPLWLVPMIPEGLMVTSISGEEFPFDPETTDTDIRFGCVAFGLRFPEGGETA